MLRPLSRLFRIPPTRARRRRLYIMLLAFFTLLTFITPFYIIYKPPNTLIRYFQRRWPDVLWHVPTSSLANRKIIALTIDDAPSQHTREILDVLRENNATATFFVIGGQVPGRQDVLDDIVAAGHELGNHAMHDEPSRSLKQPTLMSEINEVQSLIDATYTSANLPLPPRYFRPGSGFFSSAMRETVAKLGFRMVLGSVYPHDPQIGFPRVNAAHVLSMVRSGSVVICHDRRSWTAPMLRIVLPELKRRGFVVTSVSGLLEAAGQGGETVSAKVHVT